MKFRIFVRLLLVAAFIVTVATVPAAAQECEGDVIELEFMNWWGAAREALMDEVIVNFEGRKPPVLR